MAAYSMPNERALFKYFHDADRDGSGHINDLELQKVLSNGTWEPFDIKVVRMMISMFDRDNSNVSIAMKTPLPKPLSRAESSYAKQST